MAARMKFVVKRLMNSSNFDEVGQIFRRKGISMKIRMNPETLEVPT